MTIATGVDWGQQSEDYMKNTVGVVASESFWAKLRPYFGLQTEDAVHDAGLDEKDLKLTLDEAINLDYAFNVINPIAKFKLSI